MHLAPLIVTAINAGCGIAAIVLAVQGNMYAPVWLLLLAAFFDAVDGWVARKLKVDGTSGANADTIADLVSFGAAPAVIVAVACDNIWGITVGIFYGIMIVVRLIRYRLKPEPRGIFLGLPSPVTALPVAAVAQKALQLGGMSGLVIATAALMGTLAILPVRYPAWHHASMRRLPIAGRMLFFFSGVIALFFWLEEAAVIYHLIYILIGPFVLIHYHHHLLVTADKRERKRYK